MSQSIIQLLLIDDDPIFRMGVKSICEPFSDLEVIAEAVTLREALAVLDNWVKPPVAPTSGVIQETVKVAILELRIKDLSPHQNQGMLNQQRSAIAFCQQIQASYQNIPLLLFTSESDPNLLISLRDLGVPGYCPKGVGLEELLIALRQVAAGERYWVSPISGAALSSQGNPQRVLTSWQRFRYGLVKPGLKSIEQALQELTKELQDSESIPSGDRVMMLNLLITRGRYRELRAARWLVSQLMPPLPPPVNNPPSPPPPPNQPSSPGTNQPPKSGQLVTTNDSSLVLATETSTVDVQSLLFDVTVAKLQSGLVNYTGIPLEIDILKLTKKQELIYTILRKCEDLINELRLSEIQPEQLDGKTESLIRDLWTEAIADFLGKYYSLKVRDAQVEVVPVLLRDAPTVEKEILNHIPMIRDLLAHLLLGESLTIDNQVYALGSWEATRRAEALLQHWVIQVANGVMQPLLNHFADLEEVKQTFYDRRLLSTREIEKFRNNLSWRYRLSRYMSEPQSIFESSYTLFILGDRGIQKLTIYASRRQELEQLSGIQLAVTLVLEGRDAIAPRVRTAISFIGSTAVYLLTQVLGRGIGLIGRGIIQGIGSSIQDSQFRKK
ncbi:histidine kinase [Arthrospira platensis str. Paraca]|nr:histidine kinase [Arthrospira platensis str. Paraca]